MNRGFDTSDSFKSHFCRLEFQNKSRFFEFTIETKISVACSRG